MALAEAAWWVGMASLNKCFVGLWTNFSILALQFFGFALHCFTFVIHWARHKWFWVLAFVPKDFFVVHTCIAARLGTHMPSRASTSSEVQRSIMLSNTLLVLCLFRWRRFVSNTLRRTRTARASWVLWVTLSRHSCLFVSVGRFGIFSIIIFALFVEDDDWKFQSVCA